MLKAILSSALVGLLSVSLAAQTPPDVRKLLDDQTAAWNRGDLNAFMQGYWHSPEVTFFSGDTIVKGWESTLQRYRDRYQSSGKEMGKLSFTDENVEMLGTDAAMVTARWHLEMADSKKLEGLTTLLCRRMPEGWRIVHDHSS
jgi:beta-aspartyl-peptidase (threonine type)